MKKINEMIIMIIVISVLFKMNVFAEEVRDAAVVYNEDEVVYTVSGDNLYILPLKYNITDSINAEQRKIVDAKVNEIVKSVITDDMSDMQKYWELAKYVYTHATYAHDELNMQNKIIEENYTLEKPNSGYYLTSTKNGVKRYLDLTTDIGKEYNKYKIIYTSYGCLINGRCVCEGYSWAYYYLCKEAGLYTDISLTCMHAWNIIKIDDKFYNIDLTAGKFLYSDCYKGNRLTDPYNPSETIPYDFDGEELYEEVVCDDTTYDVCNGYSWWAAKDITFEKYLYDIQLRYMNPSEYQKKKQEESVIDSNGNIKLPMVSVLDGSLKQEIILANKKRSVSVTINYDLNGGRCDILPAKVKKDTAKLNRYVYKEGYTFKGWYYNDKKISKLTLKNVRTNMNLTAEWDENKYAVVYKKVAPQNGIKCYGKISNKTRVRYTKNFNLEENTYMADGYKQIGWTDGNKTYALGEKVSKLSSKKGAKITLYPVWERIN